MSWPSLSSGDSTRRISNKDDQPDETRLSFSRSWCSRALRPSGRSQLRFENPRAPPEDIQRLSFFASMSVILVTSTGSTSLVMQAGRMQSRARFLIIRVSRLEKCLNHWCGAKLGWDERVIRVLAMRMRRALHPHRSKPSVPSSLIARRASEKVTVRVELQHVQQSEYTREKGRPDGWRSGPIVNGHILDLCPTRAVDPTTSMEHPDQLVGHRERNRGTRVGCQPRSRREQSRAFNRSSKG